MYLNEIMDLFKHWINPLICLTNYVQTAEKASGQDHSHV